MSFSKEIKSEIAKSKINKNKNLIKCELLGFVVSNANIISNNVLRFSTENLDIVERYKYIIKVLCNIDVKEEVYEQTILKQNILYVINIQDSTNISIIFKNINIDILDIIEKKYKFKDILINQEDEKLAFLKGIFLGSGYLSNPKENYHLEIINQNKNDARYINNIISEFDIISSIIKRKDEFIVYIKDAQSIVTFITLLGSNVGVLKFEETRVEKEMNNNLNRVINCETANFNKSIETSKKQLENIQILKKLGKYSLLNDNLKVVCEKRIENPELSLIELANIIGISKSGLNNRFRKINEIVEDIRKNGDI